MLVKFYFKAVETGKAGDDGLPLFEDRVYLTANRDMTHTVIREATENDFKRFPEFYKAFVKAHADYKELEGYPLEMWSALRPAAVETLKMRDIRTVQELAKAKKTTVDQMPEEYKLLVKKAREFIDLAGMGSGLTKEAEKMAADNEILKEDLAEAKRTIGALNRRLEEEAA